MGKLQVFLKYAGHFVRSRRTRSFHSPYLFQLFQYACNDRIRFSLFDLIEQQRTLLKKSPEIINRSDFGAGSKSHANDSMTEISAIARSSLSHPFQCRFMSRLATWTSSNFILEFGTSLGISTSYLAAGSPAGTIHTIEGDPLIADKALGLFSQLGINNINLYVQSFEKFIEATLPQLEKIDMFFIDGNHRRDSLLHYYDAMKSHYHPGTIIIVDDIYWSDGMQEGWKTLMNKPEVTQSVDCFHFGLLFFNPVFLNREHHFIFLR